MQVGAEGRNACTYIVAAVADTAFLAFASKPMERPFRATALCSTGGRQREVTSGSEDVPMMLVP